METWNKNPFFEIFIFFIYASSNTLGKNIIIYAEVVPQDPGLGTVNNRTNEK
jgi:hypothetical protein